MSQTPTINGIGNARPHLTTPTPDGPPRYVHRQRLNAEFDAATHGPVTLVSAPAGWGKTVALAAWARTKASSRVLWLDGSAADHVEALRLTLERFSDAEADPIAPADAEGHRRRAGEAVAQSSEPLVIVLDDCDRIADPDALILIERIIGVSDGRLHVVLASRTDPLLPLHRWRVSGDLSEIRMDELAFTIAETAELLANYGIQLPYSDQAELHAVTEGWPAGLRLAALAMSHSPDPAQVIADLAVNDSVSDYITAEVLTPLSADLRRLLVDLSVVEYLSAGLVRALTGRADGGPLLADLQRRGVFIRRCAGPGEWFHLHPLLGRVLYHELRQRGARDGPEAHARAAAWYEVHGPAAETLRHELAAEDWPRATQMLEQHWPDILIGTRWRGLNDVMGSPPDAIQTQPRLAMAFGAERIEAGDPVQTHRFLRVAFGPGDRRKSHADPIAIAFDIADARFTGDMSRMRELAANLLASTAGPPTGNGNGIGGSGSGPGNGRLAEETRAVALVAMGAASLGLGDLREAGARLSEGLGLTRQIDLARVEVTAGSRLAMWNAMAGRLQAAARLSRETLGLADRLGLMHVSDLSWARLALAEVHFQWDQLDEAHRLVEQALNDACGEALTLIAGIIASAKVRLALGQLAEAHELLLAARQEASYARVPRPVRRTLTLMEAELRLAAGDPPAARQRLSEWRGDEPFPAWAATVEASILLAEGRAAAAAAVVAPHLVPPGPESSLTWMVQAGVLTALAGRAVGDQGRVTRGLDLALDAAEREGFRRPFVAGGHALRELINAVAPSMGVYRLVVADLGEVPDPSEYFTASAIGLGRMPRGGGPPVEPLTQRELTVLRYLQGTLSNVEIASTLHVSINTVKTHIRNIYRKLDAGRRREAVRRARDRRLL